MKASMRIKYMWEALIDMLIGIGKFLFQIGIPIAITIGVITVITFLPRWVSVIICGSLGLGIYLWYRAEKQYKEDAQTSRDIIREKYEMISTLLERFRLEGKTVRESYSLLTAMIDTYDEFIEIHKQKFGEDNTVRCYEYRVDELFKHAEASEKEAQERQEQRAKMLKEMGGNGEVIERGILI